ncbi:spore-associated protein A [Streptomyces sp. UG1]|uniref:spore-associated protein A n=1 Tax=Streptomyces sp. UG1 TaxID=3417652 RepID=UPI003CF08150
MLNFKRLGSVGAVLGLTVAGTVAATGTASAASYNGACGSGYSVIGSKDVGEGNTFITYSRATGKNCVVTVSDTPGTPMVLDARLRIHRTDTVWKDSETDYGTFKYYAGPVYVKAVDTCVDYGGAAASNYVRVSYNVHCG